MTSALRISNPPETPVRSPRPNGGRSRAGGHLRVVGPPSHGRRNLLLVLLAVVVVFGALLVSALLQSTFVQRQDRIDDLKRQTVELRTGIERERARLAVAESPQNLAEAATALGMVPPEHREWISAMPSAPSVSAVPDGTLAEQGDGVGDGTAHELAVGDGTEEPGGATE